MDEKTLLLTQIEELVLYGMVEGESLQTLYNLAQSYVNGCIRAEDLQCEIDAFRSDFYLKMMHNVSQEC